MFASDGMECGNCDKTRSAGKRKEQQIQPMKNKERQRRKCETHFDWQEMAVGKQPVEIRSCIYHPKQSVNF